MLSGAVAPSGGSFGLQDVVDHLNNATTFFGSNPPASVSPSAVLAPLQFGPAMASMATQLVELTRAVIAGVSSVIWGTATVNVWKAQINALMPAANAAITKLQAALPTLNNHLSAGSLHLSSDPNVQALGVLLGGSSPTLASLQGEQAAIITLSPDEATAAASFPDPGSSQQGATGGL